MAYDALRTIMPIAGWPEERAREVEISVGADRVLPTRFRIGAAGVAPRGPSDSRAIMTTKTVSPENSNRINDRVTGDEEMT
jgi:hypothetical protein